MKVARRDRPTSLQGLLGALQDANIEIDAAVLKLAVLELLQSRQLVLRADRELEIAAKTA